MPQFWQEGKFAADAVNAREQVLGGIVYGGRITDTNDMHVLMALLRSSVRPALMEDGFAFASDPAYRRPAAGSLLSYRC